MSKSILGYAGVGALLLAVSACSEDLATMQDENTLQHIAVSAKDFETDADTRTSFAITSSGAEFSWAANDTVGIFPETGAQAYFPMTSGAGTKSATFNGGGWALKASSTYAAYYPFVGNFYLNRNAVPVNYAGQTQTGDASTIHLGAYDYMAAAPVTPTGGSASFLFEHLGCLVQFTLTLADAGTVNSVTFQPSEGSFTAEGTVDLMAATPAIKATKTATSLTLDVKSVSTKEANQTVTLYMMIPPIDLSGKTLKATVKMASGTEYTIDLAGKDFVAGKAYALAGTTTGGSGTGGDDDNPGSVGGDILDALVGCWICVRGEGYVMKNGVLDRTFDDGDDEWLYHYYYSDGTFEIVDISDDNDVCETGKWWVEGDKLYSYNEAEEIIYVTTILSLTATELVGERTWTEIDNGTTYDIYSKVWYQRVK